MTSMEKTAVYELDSDAVTATRITNQGRGRVWADLEQSHKKLFEGL